MGLQRKEPLGQTQEKPSRLSTELKCYVSIAADFSKKVRQHRLGGYTGYRLSCLQAESRLSWALEVTHHTFCYGKFYPFKSGIYIHSKRSRLWPCRPINFSWQWEIWKYLRDQCFLSPEPVKSVSLARFFSLGAVIDNPIDLSAYSFLGHPALRIPHFQWPPYHFLLL